MSQKTKKYEAPVKQEDELAKIKEEFTKIKKAPVKRKVRLLYKSCCGCGCFDQEIEREVAAGSKLKDGDRVTEYLDGDKFVS